MNEASTQSLNRIKNPSKSTSGMEAIAEAPDDTQWLAKALNLASYHVSALKTLQGVHLKSA
eukprot:1140074-Pelagomonas_calceolata.AAC.1